MSVISHVIDATGSSICAGVDGDDRHGGRVDVDGDEAAFGAVDETTNDQALEAVRVEVHLEAELEPRPVAPVLVFERRSAVVVSVVIAPVGRGMGHGELVVVELVNTVGATTREWVVWWSDRPHSLCEAG